jgi:hypothetical protein
VRQIMVARGGRIAVARGEAGGALFRLMSG